MLASYGVLANARPVPVLKVRPVLKVVPLLKVGSVLKVVQVEISVEAEKETLGKNYNYASNIMNI
jgi:hypothetical protein